MKKTINAAISKSSFTIEEQAYKMLDDYLNKIENCFKTSNDKHEIMEDIELRVAELLDERLFSKNSVVTTQDVLHVIGIMGSVEDYMPEGEFSDQKNHSNNNHHQEYHHYSNQGPRKLFRDPDQRILGGVCAGLSHYFNFNLLWLRLSVFVIIVFTGVSILPYLILWLIIPKARTAADRLAMKGEPASFSNIAKNVEQTISASANKLSEDYHSGSFNHIFKRIKEVIFTILNFFKRFGGIFLLVIGFSIAIPFGMSIFSSNMFTNIDIDNSLSNDILPLLFEGENSLMYFRLGFMLMILGLMTVFLALGFRLATSYKKNTGFIAIIGLILFFIAGIFVANSGSSSLRDFIQDSEKITQTIPLKSNSEKIIINSFSAEITPGDELFDGNLFAKKEGTLIHMGYPVLEIQQDSSVITPVLEINKKANASSNAKAIDRAKSIQYDVHFHNDTLFLDPHFSFEKPYRLQSVQMLLRVPVNFEIEKGEYAQLMREEDFDFRMNGSNINFRFDP